MCYLKQQVLCLIAVTFVFVFYPCNTLIKIVCYEKVIAQISVGNIIFWKQPAYFICFLRHLNFITLAFNTELSTKLEVQLVYQ